MGKGRMTLLDVRAIVKELNEKLIGLRLSNVYNLSGRTFLFKLTAGGVKAHLLVESGIRVHLTQYEREKDKFPNQFALKLRKHIRTRRLDAVRQVGMDRVIDLQFGTGEMAHHVIVELYAAGNIVLTDHEFTILHLLRTHTYEAGQSEAVQGDEDVRVAVRERYPMRLASERVELDVARVARALEEAAVHEVERETQHTEAEERARQQLEVQEQRQQRAKKGKKKKQAPPRKNKHKLRPFKEAPLRDVFANQLGFDPNLVVHGLISAGYDPNSTLRQLGWDGTADSSMDWVQPHAQALAPSLAEAYALLDRLASEPLPGFVVARTRAAKPAAAAAAAAAKNPRQKKKKRTKAERKQRALERERMQKEMEARGVDPAEAAAAAAAEMRKRDADEAAASAAADAPAAPAGSKDDDESVEVYREFLPICLAQHDQNTEGQYHHDKCSFKEFPDFSTAMDEFFSHLEEQKLDVKRLKEKQQALRKVERVKQDHETRLEDLKDAEENNQRKAELIMIHVDPVQQAIDAVNAELARGTDWTELELIIEEQRELKNPVAIMIDDLLLDENCIVLRLSESLSHCLLFEDDDSDEEDQPSALHRDSPDDEILSVKIDLSWTPFQNAEHYFNLKKQSHDKRERTAEASAKAVEAAQEHAEKHLQQMDRIARITKRRKVHWFEKFDWFISSDNYIVIGGRDAQQNEIIVKRYLRKNDVYVHGDFHGASSVVIKNPSGGPIPPRTLEQAGTMTVCRSSAWKEKVPNSAYWVHADQVSKTAPSGEYLPTGSFMVRGKRNYLNHTPLVMAYALLFRVDESCIANHLDERKPRMLGAAAETEEEVAEAERQARDVEARQRKNERRKAAREARQNGDDQVDELAPAVAMPVAVPHGDEEEDDDLASDLAVTTSLFRFSSQGSHASSQRDEEEEEDDEDGGDDGSTKPATKPKRLSKHERKRRKRAAQMGITLEQLEVIEEEEAAEREEQKRIAEERRQAREERDQEPHGRRSKAKKQKRAKYENQDEEDRQLAKEILGVVLPGEDPDNEGKPDEEAESEREAAERRRQRAIKRELHDPEVRRIMDEEKIALAQQEMSDADNLHALTGRPLEHDVCLYAVPMCAPLSAVTGYKYKVKLVPGGMRKGKASKAALAMFLSHPDMTEVEKDLIKAIDDNELTQAILGHVRLGAGPGKKGGKGNKRRSKKGKRKKSKRG